MDQAFYETLATDLGRVLTTGPRAEVMLSKLTRWDEQQQQRESDDDLELDNLLPLALRSNPANLPERNMADWMADNIARARAPFQPHWDDILAKVRAGEFPIQLTLAAAYNWHPRTVTAMKKVVLAQKVMTREEWDGCFKNCKGNRSEPNPNKKRTQHDE